jgi:hypothetical protein
VLAQQGEPESRKGRLDAAATQPAETSSASGATPLFTPFFSRRHRRVARPPPGLASRRLRPKPRVPNQMGVERKNSSPRRQLESNEKKAF